MLRIACPIPVHGRHRLVRHTIKRIKAQTGCDVFVICMGDDADKETCTEAGCDCFLVTPNSPLGSKWQYGIDTCRHIQCDAVLYLGSSDWVSDRWCEILYGEADKRGSGMIGKQDIYFADVRNDLTVHTVYWPSYHPGSVRFGEAIGTGRLLMREMLDSINWQVFDRHLDNGLDASMCAHIMRSQWRIDCSIAREAKALSISAPHMWSNKHNWMEMREMNHCQLLQYEQSKKILDEYFHEIWAFAREVCHEL